MLGEITSQKYKNRVAIKRSDKRPIGLTKPEISYHIKKKLVRLHLEIFLAIPVLSMSFIF